jgi:hypothetical protein
MTPYSIAFETVLPVPEITLLTCFLAVCFNVRAIKKHNVNGGPGVAQRLL